MPQDDPNPSVNAAVASNQAQANQLIDVLGLRLLDPTIEDEFRLMAIQRLRHLAQYLETLMGKAQA